MAAREMYVQATLQSNSGLAKDRFENTFWFQGLDPGDPVAMARRAIDRVATFYTVDNGAGNIVQFFLANSVCRMIGGAAQHMTFTAYDLADAKPRPIILSATISLLATLHSGPDLPEEVALCLSYYNLRNLPRQRGRIYVGPLNSDAIDTTGTNQSRPHATFLSVLRFGGQVLSAVDAGIGVATPGLVYSDGVPIVYPHVDTANWQIYSRVGTGVGGGHIPRMLPVTAGWVDNEWDAQRRRRVEASARVTFP